jgi:hypothetical protein
MFLGNEENRIRHQVKNSSGSIETYYAIPANDLTPGILQDIITVGAGSGSFQARRTQVFQDPGDRTKVYVERSSRNPDGTWTVGFHQEIKQNDGGNWRYRTQETSSGTYSWVQTTGGGKAGEALNSPGRTVNLGVYNDDLNPYTTTSPPPSAVSTPLSYIEQYDALNGQFLGLIRQDSTGAWVTTPALPPHGNGANTRNWRQVLAENTGNPNALGFHEVMDLNPDGTWDVRNRPWRRP